MQWFVCIKELIYCFHLQLTSMRLAYQDLSVQQKKEEEKLKFTDPKKAQQVERLGMGFASRT